MNTYNTPHTIKHIVKISLAASGIFFVAYIFLLGNTVFDVVARKVAEQTSRELLADISGLELSTFDLYNELSYEEAKRLGFIESNPHFATKTLFVVR